MNIYRELFQKAEYQSTKLIFPSVNPVNMRLCGVGTLVLWYFRVKYQTCDGAIFTCKKCSRNNYTRKTPPGSLLYKIKLILYMQKLEWWLWRLLRTAFNFCGQRGSRQLCWPPKASAPPYALSIFLYRRKHSDVTRAEPHTRQGFLMLQRPYFLYIKTGCICSIARFWTFNPSIYVYDLRR